MSHDPKLYLAVIRHQENPSLPRDESSPDCLAPGRPDWNVLEVRLGRAEPTGGCTGLVEAGVDPASSPVYSLRQCVNVGTLELLELAILQNEARQLVPHRGKLFEHIRIRGGAGLGLLQHRKLLLL